MMLALVDGEKIPAMPKQTGLCPTCNGHVIAKCGQVNAWHWAHKTTVDCDTWAEPMTPWHVEWQNRFPLHVREIPLGQHRADIKLPDGTVVEFQHSALSVADIQSREAFYGLQMIWVFDATDAIDSGRLDLRRKNNRPQSYRTFRWKQPRRSLLKCKANVLLDLGMGWLLKLDFMGSKAPYGGCGRLVNADEFVAALCKMAASPPPVCATPASNKPALKSDVAEGASNTARPLTRQLGTSKKGASVNATQPQPQLTTVAADG